MQTGPDPNQPRCPKCQAPLGHSIGRCPFCGTEVGTASDPRSFQPAYVGLSDENRARMGTPGQRPRKPQGNKMGAAIFAAAALLLIAVGGTAAFFIIREPVDDGSVASVAPPPAPPPERPPLNINGVVLTDGPKVDPTDVITLVRARVAEGASSPTDVKLLGLTLHRARVGKVDMDDAEASVTYHYLVLHRDPRAAKEDELTAERVEFTLRADAPKVVRSEEDVKAQTVDEPTCVWNAAWRAAIASGLSEKDHTDVTYGMDEKGREAVWTFEVPDRPDSRRVIDGKTCAIKLGTRD